MSTLNLIRLTAAEWLLGRAVAIAPRNAAGSLLAQYVGAYMQAQINEARTPNTEEGD